MIVEQLHDAAQHTPLRESNVMQNQRITPPSSFTTEPLTPPLSSKKSSAQVLRIIALIRQIEAGTKTDEDPWIVFHLAEGEYDEIERALQQDSDLWGFVEDKLRYDYDGNSRRLIVRMPTRVHDLFIQRVQFDICTQLQTIRSGSDRKSQFANKLQAIGTTDIHFDTSSSSKKSKNSPDMSFDHDDALYPGVIIEVAYSQKKKHLGRLAEKYILDSDASVRVVVGLDIEYRKNSRMATLSVWRPRLFNTSSGYELRAVAEAEDEAFRNDEGNDVNHPGVRLHLSDFAHEELIQDELGDNDAEIYIPGTRLCQYLAAAEKKVQRVLKKHSLAHEVKKRKRLVTPPEEIGTDDEARYAKQEETAAKRAEDDDVDYRRNNVRVSSSK